jgi:hypothetical protein
MRKQPRVLLTDANREAVAGRDASDAAAVGAAGDASVGGANDAGAVAAAVGHHSPGRPH